MAIIDGVKNAVTAQVAARANKAVRAGLKKVSGNLLGISTTSDGPQLGAAAPRASTNKFSTKMKRTGGNGKNGSRLWL